MSNIKFNHSNAEGHQTISVFITKDDGTKVQQIVAPSSPSFQSLAAYFLQTPEAEWDAERVHGLVEPAIGINLALRDEFGDRVSFDGKAFVIDGLPVHGALANQVRDMALAGDDDWSRLARFLANVEANPSLSVRTRIWDWIERNGATLTEDGRFMGYKGLTANLTSCAKGPNNFIDGVLFGEPDEAYHVPHRPGTVISKRRGDVDDSGKRCSVGLHVGAFGYASTFVKNHGTNWGNSAAGGGSAMALVAVNPADVVSIPGDLDFKILVCKYEVTEILEDAEPVLTGRTSYDVQKTAVAAAREAREADLALLDDEERATYDQARKDGSSHAEALEALFPEPEAPTVSAEEVEDREVQDSQVDGVLVEPTKGTGLLGRVVLRDWAAVNPGLARDLADASQGHKALGRKYGDITTESSIRRYRKSQGIG